jgi:hypothetical protein
MSSSAADAYAVQSCSLGAAPLILIVGLHAHLGSFPRESGPGLWDPLLMVRSWSFVLEALGCRQW